MLLNMGLSDSKLESQIRLISMNPKIIERNYQHHVSLLRDDYLSRNSGKKILLGQPPLLGNSPDTLEANVQWFADRNIDYGNGISLGTKVKTKRKKLAWILKNVFDYREVSENEKGDTMNNMYNFIRNNPSLLVKSIKFLEKNKDKLKDKKNWYNL